MTRKRWYFCSLLLPFILPLLIIGAAKLTGTFAKAHSLLGWVSTAALFGLMFGGLQYLLFTFFVRHFGRNRTPAQLRLASWALPLWFWPWCTLWLLPLAIYMGRVKFFVMIGLFAIPYGYFYVVLAHLITWPLAKAGVITD
jgi:hypothetical protein